MKLQRRRFLQFAALAAALPAAPAVARMQAYPSSPVRLIVGYPPGGTPDAAARVMGEWLSLRLGQPFIIENRCGAFTQYAGEAVAHAPADGQTLLLISTANAISNGWFRNINFDVRRDIMPVAAVVRDSMLITVNPSFPANTFPLLLAYTHARRGWYSMASVGIGSACALAFAMRRVPGITVGHLPYHAGALATTDLFGGPLQVVLSPTRATIPHVHAGKLRALAVTAATRVEALPDVPAVAETLSGYQASDWLGLGVPNGTPEDIVERLNREINAGFSDPSVKRRLAAVHGSLSPSSADDFARLIADETERWNKIMLPHLPLL
jgi:tripartite-type tricarboxylate transporter receptor subunit TctC